MKVGDTASLTRAFSRIDMDAYVSLGGARSDFVPEPLIGALISRLLGVNLPGPGANYLKQTLTFHALAPLDAPLAARVTITRLRPAKHLVDLNVECVLDAVTCIAQGRALLYIADVKEDFAALRD